MAGTRSWSTSSGFSFTTEIQTAACRTRATKNGQKGSLQPALSSRRRGGTRGLPKEVNNYSTCVWIACAMPMHSQANELGCDCDERYFWVAILARLAPCVISNPFSIAHIPTSSIAIAHVPLHLRNRCTQSLTYSSIVHSPAGNGIPAGYATSYSVPNSTGPSDFTFITIRLAGHMVPQFQPGPSLSFFKRFLAGTPF